MNISESNRYKLLFLNDDYDELVSKELSTEINEPKTTKTKKVKTLQKKETRPEKEIKKNNLLESDEKKKIVNNIRDAQMKPDTCPGFKAEHQKNFKEGNPNENINGSNQRSHRDRENRTAQRNGKRVYDRQSGSDKTGIKSIDKREGAGAHNWGSIKEEIEDVNSSPKSNHNEHTDKEDFGNDQSSELVQVVPVEENIKQLTLDEWKALQQPRLKPQYNIRKAGEGEDISKWKKMTVLNNKKEMDIEEEFEYDPSMYPQRVGRVQRIVDIAFNFNDERRTNGGFRRNQPGRRPRVDANKNRFDSEHNFGEEVLPIDAVSEGFTLKTANMLKVDDEHQFPTLY